MSTKKISSPPSLLPSVVPPPLSCPITSSSTTSTTSTTSATSSTYSIPSSSSKQRGSGINPTTTTTCALLSGTEMPLPSTILSHHLYPTNDPSTQDFDFEDLFTFISLHNTTSPSQSQPQRRRQQHQHQNQNHPPKHHPPSSSFQTSSPANPPAPPQGSLYQTRCRGFSYSHYGNVNIPIPNGTTGHGGKETMSAAAQQLRRQVIRN